jgi:UDP-4-amino-4,6-dideoxy-N-acetyl-beta-L-altrosamine N-acetyltransferase
MRTSPGPVTLRPLAHSDLLRVREWRNRPEIAAHMATDHEIGGAEHARWFAATLDAADRRYWIINLEGMPVGLVGLYDILPEHGRASWGFYVAEEAARGRGVWSAASREVLGIAFGAMALRKVCAEVLATNEASLRVHERLGFKVDGVLRAHVVRAGAPVDVITMSLLADEWEAARTSG